MSRQADEQAPREGFRLLVPHRKDCFVAASPAPFAMHDGIQFDLNKNGVRRGSWPWHKFRCNNLSCSAIVGVRVDVLSDWIGSGGAALMPPDREQSEAERARLGIRPDPRPNPGLERLTHGRHCPCRSCCYQDWSEPELAPCGMHGSSCPPVYDPYLRDQALGRDMEPLAERPGYNAKPTDWVRYANHLEQRLAALPSQPTDDRPGTHAALAAGMDEYHAINLQEALKLVPQTGDWHGSLRAAIGIVLSERGTGLEPNQTAEQMRAAPSDGRVREAAQVLSDALEYGLDLSDTYTLEQPDDEPISATRSPQFWRELRTKHISLRAALDAPDKGDE